jgi:hypothetical protein
MMEPDLDNRNRVRNEKISRNYGSTLVRDLRERYGENFAAGHADTLTLREVITVHSLASTFPAVCAAGGSSVTSRRHSELNRISAASRASVQAVRRGVLHVQYLAEVTAPTTGPVCAGASLRQCRAASISACVAPLLRAHASAAEAVYLAT